MHIAPKGCTEVYRSWMHLNIISMDGYLGKGRCGHDHSEVKREGSISIAVLSRTNMVWWRKWLPVVVICTWIKYPCSKRLLVNALMAEAPITNLTMFEVDEGDPSAGP